MRRHRRSVVAAAAVGALALLAASCGDDDGGAVASVVSGKATHARATSEEGAAGSVIVTHVGAELYGPIAQRAGHANVAFSPLSITTALGMTRAGAKGDSAAQLDDFFGNPDPRTVHRAINGAAEQLRDLTGPVALESRDQDGKPQMREIELTNANALWGQSGVRWKRPFLDQLKADYDAGMWMTDYIHDPERARSEINDWVAEHTGEHITELLPQGSIDDATRLTLTNAIFFKAPWPDELSEGPTKKGAFTTLAGRKVDTKMLSTDGQFVYQDGKGWQSVRLPYAGGKLAMTFVLPDAGKLAQVERGLDDDTLRQILTGGAAAGVDLTFPPFDIDQRAAVGDVLRGLGVKAPFTTQHDFEPMTDDPVAQPMWVDDVLHQATVTVDKHGTEASAATAVVFTTVGAMIPSHELVLDRPFLFVIHDVQTGTPIFIGRVADPTAA